MFDRAKVRDVRERLTQSLEQTAKVMGVAIKVGRATFSDNNITFKVEVAAIGEDGEVQSREAENFKLYAYRYGLKPEDLGKTFQYGRREYTIVGCSPRSYRFPILVKREDGVTVKVPGDTVKFALAQLQAK